MGKFKEWRRKRKERKLEKADFYDREEAKLSRMMAEMDPIADKENYEALRKDLGEAIKMRSESRESKRRISKETKGAALLKFLGFAGGAVGLFSILKSERDGMVVTGEKRPMLDSIARTIGQIFWPKG